MSFELEVITPSGMIVKAVDSLRSEDSSGSFGVLGMHQDLLTILRPCILLCRRGEAETYVAVDGGILRVEKGKVTVASREAVEGTDLAALRGTIESDFYRKGEKEATFMDLLGNMEKVLLDNLVKFEKR